MVASGRRNQGAKRVAFRAGGWTVFHRILGWGFVDVNVGIICFFSNS